jgi:biopolymer transport protein ExbB/TolQ
MLTCPICQAANADDSRVCVRCGSNLRPPTGGGRGPGRHLRRGAGESLLHTLPAGLGLSLLTLGGFYLLGSLWPRAHALAFSRGWIPYVVIVLFGWSMAILRQKTAELRRQEGARMLDPLGGEEAISRERVEPLLDELRRRASKAKVDVERSVVLRRVLQALEAFRAQGRVASASDAVRHGSELDAGAVESGYAVLKVFLWAIPIFGFIGTVLGIGDAVEGFSSFIQGVEDVSRLREELTPALGGVSSGLAVAFDTTLLALLLSVPTMVLTSHAQKREEELIQEADALGAALLTRLAEREAGAAVAGIDPEQAYRRLAGEVARSLADTFGRFGEELRERTEAALAGYGESLRELTGEPVEALRLSVEAADRQSRELGRSLGELAIRTEANAARALERQQRLEARVATLEPLSQRLGETTGELGSVVAALEAERGELSRQGGAWLAAFDGRREELLTALQENERWLAEVGRRLGQPRRFKLNGIELMEEEPVEEVVP